MRVYHVFLKKLSIGGHHPDAALETGHEFKPLASAD